MVYNLAQLPGLAFVEASVEAFEGVVPAAEVPELQDPQT